MRGDVRELTHRPRFEGWVVTGWIALALALMTLAILGSAGLGVEGFRLLTRATARTSVSLFLVAFAASSLHALMRNGRSAWLLRNRRYVGVSFAVSHTVHLVAIITLGRLDPERFFHGLSWVTLFGGGLGYLFLTAMTVTSFDRTAAWLGLRRWRLLHGAGAWYLWIVFAANYLPAAFFNPPAVPFAIAVLAALLLRVAARRRRSSRSAAVRSSP